MPIFRYEAIDKTGQLRRGAMESPNEEAVRERLRLMGFTPQAVAPPTRTGAGQHHQEAQANSQPHTQTQPAGTPSVQFVTSSLSISDQALFWRQIADMIRSGMSPFNAFQYLGLRTRNRRIRRAALDVAQRTQAGSALADAMAANGDVFGTDFRMAVLAGEKGGFLQDVLSDFADTLDEEKLHRERWRWWRYYNNVNLICALVFVHLVVKMGAYITSGDELQKSVSASEWFSFLLRGLKLWLMEFATQVVPVVIGVFIVYRMLANWFEYGSGRPIADRAAMYIPAYRQFKRQRLLERFYRMLRRLLSAGVPPINAWDAAAESTGHHQLASRLLRGRNALGSGQGFAAALESTGVFPYNDIQLMGTADKTGRIPETCHQLEKEYTAKAESASKLVRRLELAAGMIMGAVAVAYAIYAGTVFYVNMYLKAADVS